MPSRDAAQPLVEPGPWHYGADYVGVYFMADKKSVQSLLPPKLKVNDGICYAYVCEIVSVSQNNPELVAKDPSKTIYEEAAIGIGCSLGESRGIYYPIMWVDREWALIRGWLNGYAKRMADSIVMTKINPLNPALQPIGQGSTISGSCVAGGKKVLEVSTRVERPGGANDLISFGSTFGVRDFPSTTRNQTRVHELVEVLKYNSRSADVWVGKSSLRMDWKDIRPARILRGVVYKSGFSIKGARVISRLR